MQTTRGCASVALLLLLLAVCAVSTVRATISASEINALQNIRTYLPALASQWPDSNLTSSLLCSPGGITISYAICGSNAISGMYVRLIPLRLFPSITSYRFMRGQ